MSTPTLPPRHDLGSLRIDERARKPKGNKTRIALIIIAVAILVAGLAALLALRPRVPLVEVAPARSASDARVQALLNASGYVTPRRRATVAAKVTGLVTHVYAEEGLQVKQGQILATLDCSQPDAALTSARRDRDATAAALSDLEVQLANADKELTRAKSMRAAGINSQEAFDTAQMSADSLRSKIALTKEQTRAAEARINMAQQDVDNCTVRSPYDGKVVSKDAQQGEIVSPVSAGGGFTRTGIATVVDMKSLEIEVDVNESYIARVKPGQKVISTLDAYPDWQIPSTVRTVIPTADRQKATVKVRVSFDQLDPRILPDMGVKVAFLGDDPNAGKPRGANAARAIVPAVAVHKEGTANVVYLVNQKTLERHVVTLGATRGSDVEIMAGLSPGDSVVLRSPEALHEGQTVEVKQ